MPLYIGLMSGTSADAIDAALVDTDPTPPRLLASHRHAVGAETRRRVHAVIDSPRVDRAELWRLDVRLGELFAEAALALLAEAGVESAAVAAIGSHGQTIYHGPDDDPPCTVQIADPNVIAERTGITTVADLRRRDLAAGGQGAPLASAFHDAVLRAPNARRVVLNIGGIANVTVLDVAGGAPATGFDTGPGNTLMDGWMRARRGEDMDADARFAASGRCDEALLERLCAEPYFALAPPKTTGRELFNMSWLERHLRELATPPAARDVQRTLCELSALTIARAIDAHAGGTDEVLVCGGGVHNPLLLERLAARLDGPPVRSTASAGVDPDWVEAMAFAWLAARTLAGLPGNLPSVTGARAPVILGGIYPGKRFD